MKNLFDEQVVEELKTRINLLSENDQPLWGKMNAAQMLAHCSEALKNGLGENRPPRVWSGYIIAPFWKYRYYNDKPFRIRNLRTHPSFKISDKKEFKEEQKKIYYWLNQFLEKGREKSLEARHPILGKFSPEQWAIGQYKHMDYHLKQFKQ